MRTITITKMETISDATYFFHKITESIEEEEISIDFSKASFIRNNFLSILGMALKILEKRGAIVKLIKPKNQKILNSMKKINFLSAFCDEDNSYDTYQTMVKYTNIPLQDNNLLMQEFYSHFQTQFTGKVENLSIELSKKILQKIFELFSNVFRHSDSTLGLFCSGQFYPKQKRFNFTIVDNGVTIKKNVNNYLRKKFIDSRTIQDKLLGKKFASKNSVEAIEWALTDKNSTTGSGGLGLSLLMELIKISKGNIEIISGNGYYSIKDEQIASEVLDKHFDGTIVSIEFNTDANSGYYSLRGEIQNG